jgi:hypothetical protein
VIFAGNFVTTDLIFIDGQGLDDSSSSARNCCMQCWFLSDSGLVMAL